MKHSLPSRLARPGATALAAVALTLSFGAQANLVFLDGVTINGAGLGTVNTVLTVQGSGGSETGAVFADGAGFDTSGDAKTGAGQVGLPSFGDLGLTDAADLRIVFNANEPASDSITLSDLTLTVFDTSGAASPTFSLAAPVSFDSTNPGIGNAGFVFGLDAAQATALNTFIMGTGMDFASFRIGLSATLDDATGGPDTFFVANADTMTPAIPEPETYALMLAGLAAVGFVARRRRQS